MTRILMRKLTAYAIATLIMIGCVFNVSASFGQGMERAKVSGWCATVEEARDLLGFEPESNDQIKYLSLGSNKCVKLDMMYRMGLVGVPFLIGENIKPLGVEVKGVSNHVYELYSGTFDGGNDKFVTWKRVRTLDKL